MLDWTQYLTALNRYILRQCLSGMLFVTGALTAAVWLAQSLKLVDLIVNRGLSAEIFLYLSLLIVPKFLDIVLPIGAFIAVLFVFNRLITESELVVMRAAGVSPFDLAKPVLVLAGIAFLIFNPGAFSHTSLALRDALKSLRRELRLLPDGHLCQG